MCHITFETAETRFLSLRWIIYHNKNECVVTLEHLSFNLESGQSNVLRGVKAVQVTKCKMVSVLGGAFPHGRNAKHWLSVLNVLRNIMSLKIKQNQNQHNLSTLGDFFQVIRTHFFHIFMPFFPHNIERDLVLPDLCIKTEDHWTLEAGASEKIH